MSASHARAGVLEALIGYLYGLAALGLVLVTSAEIPAVAHAALAALPDHLGFSATCAAAGTIPIRRLTAARRRGSAPSSSRTLAHARAVRRALHTGTLATLAAAGLLTLAERLSLPEVLAPAERASAEPGAVWPPVAVVALLLAALAYLLDRAWDIPTEDHDSP